MCAAELPNPLKTVGDIARDEGLPPYKIAYAISTYGIEPTQRAGVLRLFDEVKVAAIRSALRRISQRSGVIA